MMHDLDPACKCDMIAKHGVMMVVVVPLFVYVCVWLAL